MELLFHQSQLAHAISREDYEDAAKLKVGIAAAATKDIVGRVMSRLNVSFVVLYCYSDCIGDIIFLCVTYQNIYAYLYNICVCIPLPFNLLS